MPGREVERVEVVARGLDLAAVDDRVAEPEEDVLDLAADLRDEVEPAARDRRPRHRHVDRLLAQAAVELGAPQLLLAAVDRRLEALAEGVQRDAGLAVADVAQRELERALAPRYSTRTRSTSSGVSAAASAASASVSRAFGSTAATVATFVSAPGSGFSLTSSSGFDPQTGSG